MKKWFIHHPKTLSMHEIQSLLVAYPFIMTPQAIQMYMTLCAFSNVREGSFTSHDLAIHLNVFDHEVEPLIQTCVSVDLMQWYEQKNMVILVIKPVLDIPALMSHPLFARLLSTQDSLYFKALSMKYPPLKNDLTPTQFKYQQRHLDWNDADENQFNLKKETSLPQSETFKTSLFLQLCEEIILPSSMRNEENLSIITSLANTYLVDEKSMKKFVAKAINYKTLTLNVHKLSELILTSYQVSGYKDTSYQQHPLSFFTAINEGRPVVEKDQQLIEFLSSQYTFDQETFNFLLETILKSYHGRFTKKNAQHLAESWVRAKIKNLEDAKAYVKSNLNVSQVKAKPLPEYYEASDDPDDKATLLKQLKEMDNERN